MRYGSNGCEASMKAVSDHLARQGECGPGSVKGRGGAYKVDVGSAPPPTGHYSDEGLPKPRSTVDKPGV